MSVSEIFSFFHVLCPMLLVMGVDLLQFLDIWFIKATTEESFSLTRTKLHSLQEGTGSVRDDLFPLHSKELHPRYFFPGCLLVVACHQFNFMLPDAPLFKRP